ncbi:MAG: SprT-like domain-containing protein [Salibacteraceae bacterium]
MNREAFVAQMQTYMPEKACSIGFDWLEQYPAKLKITKPRKTKLGDFRPKTSAGIAQITVNGNLNQYQFLITFTHEVAHLIDFTKRNSLVDPHGDHWKTEYQRLLVELVQANVFPENLRPALIKHINRPKAASCSDPELLKALRQFDEKPALTLSELPAGSTFSIGNDRHFIKGPLRRTRYRCEEVGSGKYFLVHGASEVEVIQT